MSSKMPDNGLIIRKFN